MFAYCTLLNNPEYVPGVVALARSLRAVHAKAPLIVLVPELPKNPADVRELERYGCLLKVIEPLPLSQQFCERHRSGAVGRAAPFTRGIKPAFHETLSNFLKLRCWEMTEYEKIVFLDADTVVVRNVDRLFEYPAFGACPNLYQDIEDFNRMNSGVFVAKPSAAVFEQLLERLDAPGAFWRRTDQTFLETVFPDWSVLPHWYNTLQYLFFNQPRLWIPDRIMIIHYQYEKPWMVDHTKRELLLPLIDLWHRIYETGEIGNVPTPCASSSCLSV
jgi:alpha-N-acetylglucosamine transferase